MTPAQQRSVPFFDYCHDFLAEEEELVRIFRDTGRRGAFILQEDLARFERNLAAFADSHHAVGVANATDALHIALRAVGLGPGDEVIFCTHTMAATAAAIHFAGAIPVAVECGPDHLIDPAAAAAAVTSRTRALLPTHLNGRTADMAALGAIAARHSLAIVEDAAQALGSRYRGQAAGTFGAAGAISFYPAKLLGCLGDGGAILTNDIQVREQVLQLRDHGRSSAGDVIRWGFNSRLDNLQAAFLDMRLARLPAVLVRRRELARLYRQRLETVEELTLPPGPDGDPDHMDVFQNYEIEAARRDALREFLKTRGIGTLIPWGGKAVHQCEDLGFSARLPYTESLFERILLLPLNLSLTDDDVQVVCDTILDFYRSRSAEVRGTNDTSPGLVARSLAHHVPDPRR
jgi:dTDP-4-amino-4,6-dideoxygalactose transaminase